MPSDEALRRLIRVAEILAADTREPATQQRAQEILSLVRILEKENKK